MKYSIEHLRQASDIIGKRRTAALNEFAERKTQAYSIIPELSDIDKQLSASGIMISRNISSNKELMELNLKKIRQRSEQLISKKQELLKQHGFSADFLTIPFFCKKCNDTGFIDAMPCNCMQNVLSQISAKAAKKKADETSVCFDDFLLDFYPENLDGFPCRNMMRQIYENCREYAEDFSLSSPSLLLFGGTGIGKTHISLAISKAVSESGFNVIYKSAPDLFSSLEKERFNQETVNGDIRSVTHCDLLIIDDLGTEFSTSFTVSALYNIINTRILLSLPTIITANLLPTEIEKRYSERISSRLLGCFEHLHFTGNDIRILKKKNRE